MRSAIARSIALAAVALALAGCALPHRPAEWASVREVTPAFLLTRAAQDPALAASADGHVALTYVTRGPGGGLDLWLALSADSGATFGVPVRMNAVSGRVSSYAESRPLAVWGPEGRLVLAWSQVTADTLPVTDLMVRTSADGGATWSAPVTVNDDALGAPAYHGFPALAFTPDGALLAAWMDGRTRADAEAERLGALFVATSLDGGRTWAPNALVSDSLCPCCRASAASLGGGRFALAWRSAAGGVRDPVLAFSTDNGRTFGAEQPVAADHWRLDACPSDGPALAAIGESGVCVWTTGAAPAGVYLAPWSYGRGMVGPRRALLDSLERAAHPHAVPFGAGALVAVEALPRGDSVSVVATRVLGADGALTPWLMLGAHARDAALAPLSGRAALVAWVERDRTHARVRIVRLDRNDAR